MMTKNLLMRLISWLLTAVGLVLAVVLGGHLGRTQIVIQVVALVLTVVGMVTYLTWRGIIRRASLVRSGLEWVFAAWILVLLGTWILSQDPRQGLERVAWLSGYWLMLYLLLDAFDAGLDRQAVLSALLWVSGIVVGMAALEVYYRYWLWWQAVGFWQAPPYPYRLVSVLGHPNTYLAFANLFAPLAWVSFWEKGQTLRKIGAGIWLAFYLATVPFSSSRGGVIGLIAWVIVFVGLGAWESRMHEAVWNRLRAHPIWSILFLCLIGLGLAKGGTLLWNFLASNPSHGSGVLDSRWPIWYNAWLIWKSSPWFGVGPGRFGLEYLAVSRSIPPGYWSIHAHNLLLQVMSESGLLGLASCLLVFGKAIERGWQSYRGSLPEWRIWNRAILAAGTAWLTQNLLDDFSGWFAVMAPLILLVAWLYTAGQGNVGRYPNVRLSIVLLPGSLLFGLAGWILWAYYPFAEGVKYIRDGETTQAVERIATGQKRDPNLSFYATQAGLAWAEVWADRGESETLDKARLSLLRSIMLEPAPSLIHANMGVLDWYAGETEGAIQHMQVAISLSPYEPSYPLNLGWFLEQIGNTESARVYYLKALELSPSWSGHPFWRANHWRAEVLREWLSTRPGQADQPAYWQDAMLAVRSGKLDTARELIAQSEWLGESALGLALAQVSLAEAEGDQALIIASYERVAALAGRRNIYAANNFARTYSNWLFGRVGLENDLVPGYLQLEADIGQFVVLEKLEAYYRYQGDCQAYNRIWLVRQRAILGGSLERLSPPACKANSE